MQEPVTLQCEDGYRLSGTLFRPTKPLCGAIIIAPATGIKRQFYTNFATFLADYGFAVLTFDNRGIGESVNTTLRKSDADLIAWGKQDMPAALNTIEKYFPGQSYFLVGHSAGGQLIGLMNNAHKLKAFINFGSSSGSLRNMRLRYRLKAHFFMNFFIPLSNLIFGHTKAHWIGMGEPLPRGVARQWRQWCNGSGYVQTSFGKEVTEHYYSSLTIPSKWIIASDDDIANEANLKEMIAVYEGSNARYCVLYPAAFGLDDIGHMRFFSRHSRRLWPLVTNFFDEHLQPEGGTF
ncbi:alpha/beta hydrolase family protein [Salinimonas chungwhensis]|uniref:alpha/beta hydrolase family protein n=1 Tax=Salinimonas chungwhensis TaxID=265425 RepID=UPI00037A70C0|nr:alpha/beta fold hydrolase [Salinimonas chungwhensis]